MRRSGNTGPKHLVREGYDCIGKRYLEWITTTRVEERARYTEVLLSELPPGADVLDLGCGAGEPTPRLLSARFNVTGVDISPAQIALARQTVPQAKFVQADMTQLDFPPTSFNGIVAFYSLIHVPREEQDTLLQKMALWLRPGGLMVVSMGVQPAEVSFDDDFLGAPMFWSGFDAEENQRLVESAGLDIISATCETDLEFGEPVSFLWIVARKPD